MEAFSAAGESNLVFIINELDKAASGKGNGNPADVLLTLLDNLGFTDNYMECMVPTVGVYPIATANDKSQISAPLMSRFAVIDIPDYTSEEKKIIFSKYVLPKVLKRMSLKAEECVVTEDGLEAIVEKHKNTSGIRDLEQAAEHLQQGKAQLLGAWAGELLAEELRLAQQNLSEITGEFTSDDLLGRIFSSFCIGK